MSMKKYRDVPVITVDDDVVYRDDMVQLLYDNHLKHPRTIICGQAKEIQYDDFGNAEKYRYWKQMVKWNTSNVNLIPNGIGGVLYPTEFCRLVDDSISKYILDKDLIIRDDFLLHWLALKNCIGTRLVECHHPHVNFCGFLVVRPIAELADNSSGLWRKNASSNANDKSIWLFNIN